MAVYEYPAYSCNSDLFELVHGDDRYVRMNEYRVYVVCPSRFAFVLFPIELDLLFFPLFELGICQVPLYFTFSLLYRIRPDIVCFFDLARWYLNERVLYTSSADSLVEISR